MMKIVRIKFNLKNYQIIMMILKKIEYKVDQFGFEEMEFLLIRMKFKILNHAVIKLMEEVEQELFIYL